MTRDETNIAINLVRGYTVSQVEECYVLRDPFGEIVISTRSLNFLKMHEIDWHGNRFWPILLDEIKASGYSSVRLEFDDRLNGWMLQTEKLVDGGVVEFRFSGAPATAAEAICSAWLQWKFERDGNYVIAITGAQ